MGFPSLPEVTPVENVDVEALRFIVYSDAYTKFYEPFLRDMMQGWITQIVDPAVTRHWKVNDDYLRGAIAVARALLNFPAQILEEDDNRLAEEDREKKEQERLLQITLEGRGPLSAEGPLPSEPV